mmetsp:Transcript_19871/g.55840  ORF Transcript_19871/g.55840 Transcript_19871/m.55840 type:complete len:344 (+) Transcript_19871:61-1092(+)
MDLKRKAEEEGDGEHKRKKRKLGRMRLGADLILTLVEVNASALRPRIPPSATTFWQGIVICHVNDSLSSAFDKLVENRILALPVLKDHNRFYGFVDMLDVVTKISDSFQETPPSSAEDMELFQLGQFQHLSVSDAMDHPYDRHYASHPVRSNLSLFSAMETMASRKSRRLAVVGSDGRVNNVVTQSMAIRFLADAHSQIPETTLSTTMQELYETGKIPKTVQTVELDSPAISAFRTMAENQISALPVVDPFGHICDVMSIRDLRNLKKNLSSVSRLWLKVGDFKKVDQVAHHKLVTVDVESTLGEVLDHIRKTNVHRVFILKDKMPVSVVSLTDLMSYFFLFA